MSSKIIDLKLDTTRTTFLEKDTQQDIDKNTLIAYRIDLDNSYISEIFVTAYGFHDDYRKVITTIYKNVEDDHPHNTIQRNETVVLASNVLNVLLGKHYFRNELGEPIEFFVEI